MLFPFRINRNIVECKAAIGQLKHSSVLCINRNIVECKVPIRQRQNQMMCSINRNIVECKAYKYSCRKSNTPVLIETSWNVKTLNVNSESFPSGINRNIVECKEKKADILESLKEQY